MPALILALINYAFGFHKVLKLSLVGFGRPQLLLLLSMLIVDKMAACSFGPSLSSRAMFGTRSCSTASLDAEEGQSPGLGFYDCRWINPSVTRAIVLPSSFCPRNIDVAPPPQ